MGFRIGDPLTIHPPFTELRKGYISGKAFDDRAGCAVLVEAARREGAKLKALEIVPVPASRFPWKAPRPADSSLGCSKLAREFPSLAPAPWQEMAREFVKRWAKRR